MNCVLCDNSHSKQIENLKHQVYHCSSCGLFFKPTHSHLLPEDEERRYLYHQNDLLDPSYLKFLERLILPLSPFLPKEKFTTLDFGCGRAPLLSQELARRGGVTSCYDPIFFPDSTHEILGRKYDVVTCSEVVEHFKNPKNDWDTLVGCLAPNGLLAVMSQFLLKSDMYDDWWYKNDPTHVVFYNEFSFKFIADKFQLDIVYCDNKSIIIFKKK